MEEKGRAKGAIGVMTFFPVLCMVDMGRAARIDRDEGPANDRDGDAAVDLDAKAETRRAKPAVGRDIAQMGGGRGGILAREDV